MRPGSLLQQLWWHWSDACWPLWVWRPYCWLRGKHEQHYNGCAYCDKDMRHG